MTELPLVTVLLPVYNGEEFILEAARSILDQDYPNFELLLINDGSTDQTDSLIREHLLNDNRVRYHTRLNKGLIETLNEGIFLAQGEYIARMDADDVSHSNRLSRQVEFLEKHPEIAVLGTAYNSITENGKLLGVRKPPSRCSIIKAMFLFGNPFAHPTVMLNKKLIADDLFYDKDFLHAEDYELWLRLSLKFQLSNLTDICLDYRVLDQSVSRRNEEQQKDSVVKALLKHSFRLDPSNKLASHLRVLLGYDESKPLKKISSFLYVTKFKKKHFSLTIAFLYLLKRLKK